VLCGNEDDFPARGVQPVESFPVQSDLQWRPVPHAVVLDGEPVARKGEINRRYPLAGVVHPELHFGNQPVECQVYPHPRFGPRFGPRIGELECAPRLHDATVVSTRRVELHLCSPDEACPQRGVQIGYRVRERTIKQQVEGGAAACREADPRPGLRLICAYLAAP
jgi:hypothetical protein